MKKLLFIAIMTVYSSFALAWNPPDATVTMTTDSRQVTVSTTAASPTQIFVKDSFVQKTWIINASSFTVHVATSSVAFSTTTSPGIPGVTLGNTPTIFSMDGVNSPYSGPLFAVGEGLTPAVIQVFKIK